MISDTSVGVIESHRDEIRDHLKFVWSEYNKWFSFFCTLNLTAIAVVHTVGAPAGFSPLVAAFFVIDILGTASSVLICRYGLRTSNILRDSEELLRRHRVPDDEREMVACTPTETIPATLGAWAAIANLLAIVLFVCLWGYVLANGVPVPKKG